MHLVSSLLIFHLAIAHFTSSVQPHTLCHDQDRSALLKFIESLTINRNASRNPLSYPKVASWNQDEQNSDCCSWDGIKCDEDTGHVIGLNLSSSWLYGSINSSSSLFQLVHLEWLALADNHFNFSVIPSEIVNLSRLTRLSLSGSFFSGQIPAELLELSRLEVLDLSSNYYHLKLQRPGLANLAEKLTNLQQLDLTDVNISSAVPPTLANLSSLISLSLSESFLHGEFPTEIFQLPNLRLLENNFSSLRSRSLSWIADLKKLTILDLAFSKIVGEVPPALMNLTQLTQLSLAFNYQLTGPIPYWLMNLNKLSLLSFRGSKLSGRIPIEISNLTQLQKLYFAANQLEGSIPSSFFELKNLVELELAGNKLSGTLDINKFLLNMKSLKVLVLSSNKLSLLTETTVNTYSKNISVIGLRSCNLSEFPHFLYNQKFLDSVDLSSNRIAGQVPGWFLNNVLVHGFDYLNLSHNLLTGFGQDLSVLSWATTTLDLSFNKLRGPLPIPVPAFTSSYLVSNNQLTGEIPPSICSLNRLYALDLSYNNLSGMLPGCLGNFSVQLWVLKLQGNKFHGFIPETFSKGTNLRMIDFSSNLLQGRVPKSLANCVKLKFLNLGDNQITDFFPSWLGTLPELEVLILKSNNFHGVIEEPKACFEFVKLRIIDLSHNRFAGNLPSQHFECWNAMKDVNANNLTYLQDPLLGPGGYPELTYYGFSYYSLILSNKGTELEYEKLSNLITAIILSNNSFVGEIPTSIANLKGLRTLNLSNNNLQGHIPPTLGNLIVIESLDLSNNKLSGQIPQQLGELTTLEVFDVSDNLLTGPIPQGKQFNTFGKGSFDGNPGLCGRPLSKKCDNSATSPPEEDPRSESLFAFGWKTVLIGYASGTVIGVVLGHIFSTRKYEWLAKTFRLQPKTNGRRTRVGRHRQRM
ncbi:hypothetical protein WN944_011129 [Citrus x changshan-huyou]|uniref:Leucine-rich repeat-containing N-terminal plant-type domain-containing protein n=1 Tax=Citrus x changshan-huyou TaxID=2935761 RepID=A0AAP0MXQ1_9ROSI